MDTQRMLLFVALALVLVMMYSAWQADYGPRPAAPAATEAAPAQAAGAPAPAAGDVPPAGPAATPTAVPGEVPSAASQPQASALESGEQVRVRTDLLDVRIDTLGGDVREAKLLDYPVALDQPDEPFVLMRDEPDRVFIAQTGLVGERGSPEHHTVSHYARFTAEKGEYRLEEGADALVVPLTLRHPSGLTITKTLTFHRDSYVIDVAYRVDNGSEADWSGSLYGQFQRSPVRPEDKARFIYTYTGGAISGPEKHYQKVTFDDMTEAPLSRDIEGGWAAMIQHYFLGAWIPDPDQTQHYYSRVLDGPRYLLGFRGPQAQVPAGASGELATRLYVGPKEHDRLPGVAPHLELAVDYGYLSFIAEPLFWVLKWIHDVVRNWGWSIIIVTLLIKLAFFQLSATSYKSMAQMRKLAPRLQTLKERFGDDRQKLNQAMMELYKKEKINPLGGCLPILVQIPVFISLYWVLLESVELRQASFMFWLDDLSSKDPYYVLPLIMGVSMFVQQRLNPAPPDPVQAKVMMALPVVFTVFFAFFPAGLVLYWTVNNLLSIAQQWYITRKMIKA
jgi:YidC/Oxa1 family membrane protein insertase